MIKGGTILEISRSFVRLNFTVLVNLFIVICSLSAGRAQAANFQETINNASDGVVNLDPEILYTGRASILSDVTINGNDATLDISQGETGFQAVTIASGVIITVNNMIVRNGDIQFLFEHNSEGNFSGVTFMGGNQAVAHNSNGTLTFSNCQFQSQSFVGINAGFDCDNGGNVSLAIDGSSFNELPNGVQSSSGASTITNCQFTNIDNGISGSGTFEITNCTFENFQSAGFQLIPDFCNVANSGTATINDSNFKGGNFGIIVRDGKYFINNCALSNLNTGLSTQNDTGTVNMPSQVNTTDFINCSEFGIHHFAGGVLHIRGGQYLRCERPIQVKDFSETVIDGILIDDQDLECAGVGIALRNQSVGTIINSDIRGHLNGIDAKEESQVSIENCIFRDTVITGVVASQGTEFSVQRCEFIDSGQDALFAEPEGGATPHGIVEDCVVLNAGFGPGDLPCRTVQAGTGMVFIGAGPYRIERNYIFGSFDSGISLERGAAATFRNNSVVANRLSGIQVFGAGDGTFIEDNIVIGHTNDGQAGILISCPESDPQCPTSMGAITFRRNMLAGNFYGIAHQKDTALSFFEFCLVAGNQDQGMSLQSGDLRAEKLAFLQNGDFQIFSTTDDVSTVANSSIWADNLLGAFTNAANPFIAENCYWGNPEGPFDTTSHPNPGDRMGYQNVEVTPFLDFPPVEAWYSGDPIGGSSPGIVPRTNPNWLQVSAPTPTEINTVMGAMRPTADRSPVPPSNVLDTRPLFIWTSPNWRSLPEQIQITLNGVQTTASNSGTISAFLARFPANEDDAEAEFIGTLDTNNGVFSASVHASSLLNGIYYVTSIGPAPTPGPGDQRWIFY